jgi:anti-sigma factor RsiW
VECSDLVELMTAYLEGSMELEERARFDVHLIDCDGCANYLQQFRQTVLTVGRIREDQLDPAYLNRLLDAFKTFRPA